MNCDASLYTVEGSFATYHVLEEVSIGDRPKECVLKVVFNRENNDVNCDCPLFEFRGNLCRHVLSVFTQERVKNVLEKYILTRWKRKIKMKHSYIKNSYGVKELKPQMDMFEKLSKHFYEVAEVATESKDATKALHEILHQFNSNVSTMDTTINKVKISYVDASSPNTDNEICSPLPFKRKGRPPSKRIISMVEKIVKRSRNQTNQSDDRETTFVGSNTSFFDLLSQFSTTT
ncbi:protein FAR1-RELATED SEQUENCE 6-like [Cicer arietinum]|uniref:protein FAR1-RELATED SEQUENCE 6-like n=1 Tax=Cicer arietinum TaxID=3827 RepID=UPI003CC56A05